MGNTFSLECEKPLQIKQSKIGTQTLKGNQSTRPSIQYLLALILCKDKIMGGI